MITLRQLPYRCGLTRNPCSRCSPLQVNNTDTRHVNGGGIANGLRR